MNYYHINIKELAVERDLDKWLSVLPASSGDYVRTYKKSADQWRVLAGRLLLRYALEKEDTGFNLSQIVTTVKGRPYIEGIDLEFNLSHSGDIVVLVTGENLRLGIDVELHREVDIKLFRRNFTDDEWSVIQNASDSITKFFDYWTIKESLIKADGRGVEVLGKTSVYGDGSALCDGRKWHYKQLQLFIGYSAALAYDREEDLNIIAVAAPDLLTAGQ